MMRETNPQAQDRPRPPVVSREHVYVCKFCLQEQLPGTSNPVSAAAVCVVARGTNRANAKATTTAFVFAHAGQLQAHYRQHHSEYATPPAQEHTLKQHVYDYLARQAREDNYARMRQRHGQAKRIQTGAQQLHAFWTNDGAARAHEYNAVVEAVRGANKDMCCDNGVDDEASESESDSFVVADGEGETSEEESSDVVEEEDEDGLLALLESEVRYKGAVGVVTGLDFETVLFTVVFEDGRCEWRADKVRRFAVRSERKVRKGAPRIAVLEDLAREGALVQERCNLKQRKRVWQADSSSASDVCESPSRIAVLPDSAQDKASTTEHGTVQQRKRVWQADSSSASDVCDFPPNIAVFGDCLREKALVGEHGTPKQRKRVWQADSSSASDVCDFPPNITVFGDCLREKALVGEHDTPKQRKRVWQADSSSDSA